MDINLFYNQSDSRYLVKRLVPGETVNGDFRDECNIMSPVLLVQSDAVLRYNYCFIPMLNRYYNIASVNIMRTGLYEVSLSEDVLMSFKNDIVNTIAIVDKQTTAEYGDEYIDDSSLVTDNLLFAEVYNFDSGFDEAPEIILITAG